MYSTNLNNMQSQSFTIPRDTQANFEVKTLMNKINAIYPEVQQGIDNLKNTSDGFGNC